MRENVLDNGNSEHKDPEVGMSMEYSRTSKSQCGYSRARDLGARPDHTGPLEQREECGCYSDCPGQWAIMFFLISDIT